MLYKDQLTVGGAFKPVAFKAECRFCAGREGLVYEHKEERYDVDPDTMKRTPSNSIYPLFISKERRV